MIIDDNLKCPKCNLDLTYYDKVQRIIRTKNRKTEYMHLLRFQCNNCHTIHRQIPKQLFPFKQYESEVIQGVLDGIITSDILGYEDYPCEMTMRRWRLQKIH
ncbi:MAG: DUF6431 domain-containing protein [Bacillota bacterium]